MSTVGLMYMLAGSWVSILVYRRRLLCSLSHCFDACRGRSLGDIVLLPSGVLDELGVLVSLAPLAVTNLRAQPAERLYTVDAS